MGGEIDNARGGSHRLNARWVAFRRRWARDVAFVGGAAALIALVATGGSKLISWLESSPPAPPSPVSAAGVPQAEQRLSLRTEPGKPLATAKLDGGQSAHAATANNTASNSGVDTAPQPAVDAGPHVIVEAAPDADQGDVAFQQVLADMRTQTALLLPDLPRGATLVIPVAVEARYEPYPAKVKVRIAPRLENAGRLRAPAPFETAPQDAVHLAASDAVDGIKRELEAAGAQ